MTPVTPFSDDLSAIDVGGLKGNIEFLAAAGVKLLYPCGNTGEFNSLSLDEWTSAVETCVAFSGDSMRVAPGVGQGFSAAMEMLRRTEDVGGDGVLLMPPHPTSVSEEGLRAYYLRLIEASPVPAVFYRRGGWPSDDLLAELTASDGAAGVKYGDPDVNAFAGSCGAGDAVWTCGLAERWAPFFHLAGAEGFTSGLANFAPGFALSLFDALRAGEYEAAMKLRETCLWFEEIRALDGSANNVAAVKTAMDAQGLKGGKVRPPLRDLDSETSKEVLLAISGWT